MKVAVIGAGVGGLTLALALAREGIKDIDIYEASSAIGELGVGINILPHAMRILDDLGLQQRLLDVSVQTTELCYLTHRGQLIWREQRGISAGYQWPQISIHRGKLIDVLHRAVLEQLGPKRIHTNTRLESFEQHDNGSITFIAANKKITVDCLVGCDGVHSMVRNAFYPHEGPPKWDGITMWRAASFMPPSEVYESMVIAGKTDHRMVMYPIIKNSDASKGYLVNWVIKQKTSIAQPMPKQDWNHATTVADIPARFADFQFLNIEGLIKNAPAIYKYPQVDRDPLPTWAFEHITLLGDAAHPMYPSGSNGASQAIIDAEALARELAHSHSISSAIHNYDRERREATTAIVWKNREAGPEKCIDIVEQRAPLGFDNLADVIDQQELSGIVASYKKVAGFALPAQIEVP